MYWPQTLLNFITTKIILIRLHRRTAQAHTGFGFSSSFFFFFALLHFTTVCGESMYTGTCCTCALISLFVNYYPSNDLFNKPKIKQKNNSSDLIPVLNSRSGHGYRIMLFFVPFFLSLSSFFVFFRKLEMMMIKGIFLFGCFL